MSRSARSALAAVISSVCLAATTVEASADVWTTTPATAAVAGSAAWHEGTRGDGLRDRLTGAMSGVLEAGATGMIARVDDDSRVTTVTLGAARLEPRRPITVNDQVRVGSITKSMVATVVLQLVGERRLRLNDSIEDWLPGVVPNGEAITLRMVLSHTSGLFDYGEDADFITRIVADPDRYWSPRDILAVALAHPPTFPPGAGWSYSNTGYILLGLVLERVTGQPIQTVLERRVFRPLHLSRTFFALDGRFRGTYAHGYLPPSLTGGGYQDTSSWPPSWAWAAGAVVSTAADVARFYQGLMSGHLLRPSLLREMTKTVPAESPGRYGLGLAAFDLPCGTVWGHTGGIFGYSSFAFSDRSGRRSAVLLIPTEFDQAIATAISPVLAAAWCGMFGQTPPMAGAASVSATSLAGGTTTDGVTARRRPPSRPGRRPGSGQCRRRSRFSAVIHRSPC
jgi:D-alanyl-D-alanine carboxypeptidase